MGKAFVLVGLLMGRAADKIGDAVGYPCGFSFGAGGFHPLERGGGSSDGGQFATGTTACTGVMTGIQDGGSRAMAFRKAENGELRPAGPQSLFDAGIRATEAVDGLIRVANAEEA